MKVWTPAGRRNVLAGLLLLGVSGCASHPAAPSSPPAAASDPAAASTAPPATASAPATTSPAALSLSDRGVGGLELGMTRAKALATGLVGRTLDNPDAGPDSCVVNAGKRGIDRVFFVRGKVRIIAVSAKIRLDTGIGVGDTYRQLHLAYPDGTDTQAPGRLYLPAPRARISAEYRIGLDTDGAFPDSKITEIALQAADNGCYE
jgi:hypothetical protein